MKKRFVSILLVCTLMLGTFSYSAIAEGTHANDDCGDACTANVSSEKVTPRRGEVCPMCGESTGSLYCDGDKVIDQDNITDHWIFGYGTCYYIIYVSTASYMCGMCGTEWPYSHTAYHYCDEYHEHLEDDPDGPIYEVCTLKYGPPFEWSPVDPTVPPNHWD